MNKFLSTAISVGTTTETENGDVTFSTSLDACVDLFFQIGAIRGQKPARIRGLFSAAYGENPDLASKILLWARDIRGGAGERETFREVLRYLSEHDTDRLGRLLNLVPTVGRWDDLFAVIDNERARKLILPMYRQALLEVNGLAAKWAPRKGPIAKMLREYFEFSPKEYRRAIVAATKVVETQMCAKEWEKINYEHVPSVASARYGKAFGRHDQERYAKYLEAVKKGEKKINTGAVYPYDVIKGLVPNETADVMWNNLPDYVPERISFLPVIDVSGSMTSSANGKKGGPSCMDVAVSLGIYLAERNKTAYNRMCMTFNTNPRIFQIPKGTIREKVAFVKGSDHQMCGSTDLDKAMKLIVDIAIQGKVPSSDMPTHLLILSDMEFNPNAYSSYDYKTGKYAVTASSASERTQELFIHAGYKIPNIIWWNIQSRHGNTPIRFDQKGMALVSGFSPSLMKSLLANEIDPVKQMMATVDIERYNH